MTVATVRAIETNMAIVIDIHLSGIELGIKCKDVSHRIAFLASVIDAELTKLSLVF